MRILMATDTYIPKIDGIVTSVVNTSKFLAKRGHKVVILCPEYDKPYTEKKTKNVRIYRFRSFSFPSYKEFKVAMPDIRKLIRIYRRFKPDVVHIHTPGPIGFLGLMLAKNMHIPIVNTYHTSLPDVIVYASPAKMMKLEHRFSNFVDMLAGREKNIRKLQELYNDVRANLKDVQGRFNRFVKKYRRKKKKSRKEAFSRKAIWAISKLFYMPSDLVIAPSKRIEDELLKHGVSKVALVSNGIEINMFRKKHSYSKIPVFLHVGRLGFEKRVDVIINAMKIVSDRYPGAVMDIIGDGPARLTLETQARKLGLEKNLVFHGFIDRKKLPAIYRKHDVFVTASEMETQGLVLIEAMASGLPVIGVNVLAIPDVVHNNATGYLVRRRSSQDMAAKMIRFIEQPAKLREFGRNARIEAEKHDVCNVLKALENNYARLINNEIPDKIN